VLESGWVEPPIIFEAQILFLEMFACCFCGGPALSICRLTKISAPLRQKYLAETVREFDKWSDDDAADKYADTSEDHFDQIVEDGEMSLCLPSDYTAKVAKINFDFDAYHLVWSTCSAIGHHDPDEGTASAFEAACEVCDVCVYTPACVCQWARHRAYFLSVVQRVLGV
jgi:hypothetical protein